MSKTELLEAPKAAGPISGQDVKVVWARREAFLHTAQGERSKLRRATSFASLVSEADTAYSRCTSAWAASLASKLAGRAALADVLAKVLPREGGEMRQTVTNLDQAAGRLPLAEVQALQVRRLLDHFDDLMNKIGLSDDVGEFLKDVAGPNGATLNSLEKAKVQEFLDEHKLRGVFRVRLQ
jgi:hypothetical protein